MEASVSSFRSLGTITVLKTEEYSILIILFWYIPPFRCNFKLHTIVTNICNRWRAMSRYANVYAVIFFSSLSSTSSGSGLSQMHQLSFQVRTLRKRKRIRKKMLAALDSGSKYDCLAPVLKSVKVMTNMPMCCCTCFH